jgi:threonine dehydrogenase-like Zn-dependent dehydrogenase
MLDGGQAEFVRVPYANGTLKPLPTELDASLGIMMSDILPTGYYGTMRALDGYLQSRFVGQSTSAQRDDDTAGMTMVCIGCGPVGLCAILTARHKGVARIYAIDSIQDRLEKAKCFGAIPLKLGQDDIQGTIMAETDGRGADAVVELVGNTAALRSAFDMLRPSGTLSSIGFHQGDLPFTALECYQKNLK